MVSSITAFYTWPPFFKTRLYNLIHVISLGIIDVPVYVFEEISIFLSSHLYSNKTPRSMNEKSNENA